METMLKNSKKKIIQSYLKYSQVFNSKIRKMNTNQNTNKIIKITKIRSLIYRVNYSIKN